MLYYTMCFFASEEVRSVLILVVLDDALVHLVEKYVCTLIRQKLGEHIYLHEFFRNSKGQNCKFTKNGSKGWLRDVYNQLFYHPAKNFSEWMEKVDDTANRGRSINQDKIPD